MDVVKNMIGKKKCVLCNKEFEGYGNNPAPLKSKGQCCDYCNAYKVIPERLRNLKASRINVR